MRRCAGLLYTAMPRGDMSGSAFFLDKKNQLQGEVVFGKIAGREHEALLQRPDSILTSIYQVTFPEPPRATSPAVSAMAMSREGGKERERFGSGVGSGCRCVVCAKVLLFQQPQFSIRRLLFWFRKRPWEQ